MGAPASIQIKVFRKSGLPIPFPAFQATATVVVRTPVFREGPNPCLRYLVSS